MHDGTALEHTSNVDRFLLLNYGLKELVCILSSFDQYNVSLHDFNGVLYYCIEHNLKLV